MQEMQLDGVILIEPSLLLTTFAKVVSTAVFIKANPRVIRGSVWAGFSQPMTQTIYDTSVWVRKNNDPVRKNNNSLYYWASLDKPTYF